MNYPVYSGYQQMPMNQPIMPTNQGFNQQQFTPSPQPTIISERTSIPMQPSIMIPIESVDKARNYPTAPGNTVFLKDIDGKHLYVKSVGFTQFDNPVFDIYIKEDEMNIIDSPTRHDEPSYLTKNDLDYAMEDLNHRLDKIQEDIKRKPSQPRPQNKEK